jgi:hypothetical protein
MKSELHVARTALAIAILVIVSSSARADRWAYAVGEVNGVTSLYKVDLTTWTATDIGSVGTLMEGLATAASGQLYGTDDSGYLYLINHDTGQTTLIGSTGQGDVEGLDYDKTRLLGVSLDTDPPVVFSIDTTNATTQPLVTATQDTGGVRAMCVRDNSTVFVVGDGPPAHTLYSINLNTGAVTTIGTLNVAGTLVAAMDFVDGTLYCLDLAGNEYTINTTNADVTFVGNTGGQLWLDMKGIPPQ